MSENIASPPSFRQRFERANALWSEGRFQDAEEAYLELLKEDPSSSSAACRIGDIRLALGDRTGAQEYFSRAVAINPTLPWGHMGLARIAEATTDTEAALAHYKDALERSSGQSGLAEHIGTLINGINSARQKARTKEEQAEFLRRFEEANQLIIDRQLEAAETIYRELLAIEPNSAPLLCKLAGIAVEFGRIAEARVAYDRAIAANPNFPWAHVGLSEILEASGEFDAALDALEVAIALDGSLGFAQERRQSIRKKRQLEIERIKGVQIRHWPADQRVKAEHDHKPSRPRVAIIAWDLSHNPVGRALALAEVGSCHADCEIVGPIFSRYGDDLWGPLRESSRTFDIRGYSAHSFYSFMEGAIRLVIEKPCDVAWVSKPRLPSSSDRVSVQTHSRRKRVARHR